MTGGALIRLSVLVAAAETVGLMLASGFAYWMRAYDFSPPVEYVLATIVTTGLAINLFFIGKTYRWQTHPSINTHQIKALVIWVFVVLVMVTLFYMLKATDQFSRGWLLLFLVVGSGVILLVRSIAYGVLYRWQRDGHLREPVAVLGSGRALRGTITKLMSDHSESTWMAGGFVMAPEHGAEPGKVFGSFTELLERVRDGRIRRIILAFDDPQSAHFVDAMRTLRLMPVSVMVALPQFLSDEIVPALSVGQMGGQRVLSVTVRPMDGIDGLVKMLEDRILGGLLLILAAPVMAVIALVVLAADGRPVIFRQRRAGFEGNQFVVYKFRTMRTQEDGPNLEQARREDPRVTRIGAVLRRTSMDELPQLINVLKGEMSIVGPRPHALAHDNFYASHIDGYLGRYRVKPGLTGWAQVNGLRGETNSVEKMQRRIEYDLHYIENWSLLMDLRIILMTIGVIFGTKNAY